MDKLLIRMTPQKLLGRWNRCTVNKYIDFKVIFLFYTLNKFSRKRGLKAATTITDQYKKDDTKEELVQFCLQQQQWQNWSSQDTLIYMNWVCGISNKWNDIYMYCCKGSKHQCLLVHRSILLAYCITIQCRVMNNNNLLLDRKKRYYKNKTDGSWH